MGRRAATWIRRSAIAGTCAALVLLACAVPAFAADPSPPTTTFVSWTESSSYAHYNAGNDLDRLWFNPNYADSATARVCAQDPDSGIAHVTWPTPPTDWSPVGSNQAVATSGCNYDRTFTWVAGAVGGTVNVTSDHGDPLPPGSLTSAPATMEFVADSTAPLDGSAPGSFYIQTPGWFNSGNNRVYFPAAASFTDPGGSSATGVGPITRLFQRRDGVAVGNGSCDVTAGSWTTVATNPAGTNFNNTPEVTITAPGLCAEFRYRIEDAVGNARNVYASGFRGWDNTNATVTVTSIVEGANPQYQKVVSPTLTYINGNQSGDFTVNASVADDASGMHWIRFEPFGVNWTPAVNSDIYEPGPYQQSFAWTAGAGNPGARRIRVQDYAGNAAWVNGAYTVTRDNTGPAGGSLSYWTGTWRNTLQVDVDQLTLMTDTQAGIASYQLQRDEAPYVAGACTAFGGLYATNVGAPVLGDPPPSLGTVSDTGVANAMCYRYRIEATDHVLNYGYQQPANTVIVDNDDPTVTLNALPSTGSGTLVLGGTTADPTSGVGNQGVENVTVRLEPLVPAGPITTIYTDNTINSGGGWNPTGVWGNFNWNTTALNGQFRLHIDITDVAGNTVTSAVTHDILLDNSIPTMTFDGFTEATNPGCQHTVGTSAWVKTNGICDGSIIARFTPVDSESGIARINVPAGPAGWTPNVLTQVNNPGPYEQEYVWTNGAANFGTRNATATNNSGMNSTNTPFTITTDNTNPVGGAITYATGWYILPTITINITGNYTDAASGVYQQRLLRDEVARPLGGTCGGATWPGTYAHVVDQTVAGDVNQTLPATIVDSSIATGMCYRYRLVADDNVSNTTGTTVTPTPVAVDLVDPTVTMNVLTPTSPFMATENLTGTSDDGPVGPNSGVANVTLRWENLGDSSTGTIGIDNSASPNWAINWNTNQPATPDGNYRIYVDVTDVAGRNLTNVVTRDVVIDNSPPTISMQAITPLTQLNCQYWPGGLVHYVNRLAASGCAGGTFDVEVNADDLPGGIQYVRFSDNGAIYPTLSGAGSPYDVTAAPWKTEYTYTSAIGTTVRNHNLIARGNSGAQTTMVMTLVYDAVGPTGMAFTGPGGTTSPSYWTNASSVPVTFDMGPVVDPAVAPQPGAGVRLGSQVVSRRETTNVNCSAGWSAWTTISGPGPASPYPDGSVATGTCYQYRIGVTDNVNNTTWFADTTNQVRVDQVNPTGTMAPVPAYVRGSSVALSGTSADNWAGVGSIQVRLGAGPAMAAGCDPVTVAASWNCTWDTTSAPNGPTTLTLIVTDRAGNVMNTVTQPTYVDNELPAGTVTLAEGASPQWQHVVPGPTPRIYVNTDEASGDFSATVAASDAFSGVQDVQLPGLGAGWTGAATVPSPGPYTTTYGWTGPGAADPGAQNAVVRDNALNTATAPFEVVADVTDPTGTSIQYTGGPTSVPAITFAQGSDAGSGLLTWRIERRETTVIGPGACDTGGWSAWSSQVTDPAVSPWTDTLVTMNMCYEYRVVAEDNVGNAVVVSDPEGDVVTIEPAGIVIVESGGSTDVTEGGATDTYTVALRTIPASNVTVTLGNVDGQVTTSSPTLTFTPANWNVPQVVTVTAVNDAIDEVPDPHPGQVTHVAASADPDYSGLAGADVVANVTDDDTAAIILSPDAATVDVDEAGATSDTYTITLGSQPTADVDITLGNVDGQVTYAPPVVTLDAGNWNTGVVVTVTAVDDAVDEAATHPGVVTHAVASGDPLYAPLTLADVTADVTDDDTAGVTVTPTAGLTLDENDVPTTAQYTVVLDSQPLADVTITVTGDADAGSAPGSLLFTTGDWNVPQPVTMTVVDDLIVEGPHTATSSHLAGSPDPAYAGIAVAPVVADVTDNDVPGITVSTAGPIASTEGGASGTYQIRLDSQPTAPVDISFATGSQLNTITTLTFDAFNWNVDQTVTAVATDDFVDEATPHPGTIAHTVSSADLTYNGWVLADMAVDITDNDTAGITVNEFGGVQVDEANVAATDTFSVVLDSQPLVDVTLTVVPDAQVTTSGPLTFTTVNWNVPQTVTVTAVDDPVDEASPHPSTIAFTVAAIGDPLYDARAVTPVTASVLDDDTAGITVSPGTLAVDETGPTSDSYTVVLDTQPLFDVTVNVAPDAQVATTDTTLTFTPVTWNVPQTVDVDAVDDPRVETTPHAGQLTHSVTTADVAYGLVAVGPKLVDVTDNDVAGITVDELGGVEVFEGGATDTYTIVLDAQPGVGETVTVDLTDDAQVDVSPTQVVFTDANWNVPATITVTAVNDPIQEADPHPGLTTHAVSSTDPLWAAITTAPDVTADVRDDDVAAIVVTHTSPYALDEDTPAATVSYDVVLATQPASDVTINLTVPGDLAASTTSLVFTTANWNVPQTVTVNAIDDLVTELPSPIHTRLITHAVVTGDAFYGPLTVPDMQFDVTDNDIPGITVDKVSLAATEGGAGESFSVVLDTMPAADVTVTLTGTQVGFDVNPLVFTAANWNVPQIVMVDAIDDAVDEAPDPHAGLVELAVTSADGVYDTWPLTDIPVDITDNDTAGVIIAPGSGTPLALDEATASSAPYTVVLATQPTADVTVTIATADGQTTTSTGSLVFNSGNWNVPQPVTVTAVDDAIDEADPHPGLVTHVASSLDTHYSGALAIDDQTVSIDDDDTAAINVTPTAIALDEAAPATTATFDVVLGAQPLSDVTVTVATPDGQTTASSPTLTFTPVTWNLPQTVTVTVVDDLVDEVDPHTGTVVLTASSLDALYGAIDPADVVATIDDDDTAGVTISESAGTTDVDEASLTDTYDVVLDTQPLVDVTIAIATGGQASTDVALLTFTPLNWNVAQTVTVSGVPDALVEGPHTDTITHAATSLDPNYNGIAVTIADVIANIADDDVAGATVTPTSLVADEDGTLTPTYSVVLDAQPTADVDIALTLDPQVSTGGTTLLTFTSANWNVPQIVTVTAVDDLVTEPTPHTGTITHAMTSVDPDFNVPVSDVTVDITDNDIPGVTVTPTNTTASEAGLTGSFDVVLDTIPGADVTVNFTTDSQLVAIAPLLFTAANWNVPQTVTVTAVDDLVQESNPHPSIIDIDTASLAPAYGTGALTISDVTVDITDNDTAGVLVAPLGGLSGNEGDLVSYQVSLTSQPTDDVEVTLAGDADGSLAATTYLFTPLTWNVPQTVDVTLVQDLIAEGAHTTTITGSVTDPGTDAFYGAVAIPDQTIDIADDDVAGVTFTPVLPGPLGVAEDGSATAGYDIVLDTQPTGDVTIDLTSLGGQVSIVPATLTFTSGNWNVAQPVAVTAIDDPIDEPTPHPDTITHLVGGADPVYTALVLGDMDVNVDDDDTAGVRIDVTGPDTQVTEGGATDTVEVVLESQPTADVTVTLTGVQVGVGPNPLTFTSANWNVPQVVTVTAIDDFIAEGAHLGTIDAVTGSIDPNYAGVSAVQSIANITDNDTAGVVVTQPVANVLDEATPLVGETYQVRLQSEPTADVDVTIIPDGQLAAAPLTLTFTPLTWNVDQDVTVTPIDDAVAEADPHPGFVAHDTTSLDLAYATGTLTIDTADFDIADNDTPGISITPTTGHAVVEGGATSTYDVVLLSQPTADVTFTPVSTQLEWSVPSITFTAINWNVPQPITLQAIDDTVDEVDPHPGTLDMAIASADLGYAGLTPATVDAMIGDNDTSDLVVTPVGGLTVDEAGVLPAAQYVLTLTSTPSADVDVALAPDAQVLTSVATATLTAANWNTGVTIDVTAVDDLVQELDPHPGTIAHAMSSADLNFDGETGPGQLVDVVDNDTAGVSIVPSAPDTTVAEDGSITDSYDVVLQSQPAADVTITITPDAQVAVAPTTLTFNAGNWNVPQTVAVTAVDDAIIETPTHPGTISHVATSADTFYDAIPIADETANVLDDDVAGVIVTPAGGTFAIAEGGTTDDIVITLTSQPVAPVTINLATPDGESTTSVPSVLLDSTNWNTGVTVTVTAVDDGFIEGSPHPAAVTLTIDPSSDPAYLALLIPDAIADVTDNDSASVIVDDLGGISVDEANVAGTDTFEVRLGASPNPGDTVDVAVSNAAGQVLVAPSPLTFDDSNWNVPQVVTVTVVDDPVDEADPHTSPIAFATTSVDPNFNALVTASVDATIADDDTAGIVVDTSTVAIDETGPTNGVVQVQLASQPVGDVEVDLVFDAAQVAVAPAGPLTFTPANWNVDQAVTITAVDDPIDEASPHQSIVSLDASSVAAADPNYDAVANEDVTADITDNDTSGVTVTLASGTETDEANAATTMTYDVVLDTEPTGSVDVAWTVDAQLAIVSGGTLTFTPANWSVPQQVVVRAADDPVDETDPHPGLLSITMGGADPVYAGLTPPALNPDVRDDDVAGVIITQGLVPQPIDEGGPATTYTVALATQPTADVDVTLTPDAQVDTGGATTLTFTPANWNVAQVVNVTAIDDTITEPTPHVGLVAHATDSLDPNYALVAALAVADAEFDITDNDVAGFTLIGVPPNPAVAETGATSATYELTIDTTPLTDVTVDFAATNGDVTVSPASHTFPGGVSPAPVTITVTAIDDFFPEGPHTDLVTHVMAPGSDPTYLAIAPPAIADVTVDVADDDTAELIVDDLGGSVLDEADVPTTDTFTLVLGAEPTSNVDVAVGTADGQTTVDLPTVTFTPATWNVPQTVTATVVDDPIVEPTPHAGTVTFATTSADTPFNGMTTADLVHDITDNDIPGFVIVDSPDMTMDEADVAGTERTMSIALATQPQGADTVVVNAVVDAQLGLQTVPTLTFDNANWNVPQVVTLRAINDAVDEASPHPGVLSLVVDPSTTEPNYGALTIPDRTFDIADDDTAGFTVTPPLPGPLAIHEDGSVTATYDVVLTSQPTADVAIAIAAAGGQATVGAPTVTFTSVNWNVPQTVTVTAVQDPVDEADPHADQLTHAITSADATYAGLTLGAMDLSITDDDTAGVTVTQVGAPQPLAEDGSVAGATYTVELDSQPTADVTITLGTNAQVDPSGVTTLTFTTANWNVPQTVTVDAIDDLITEATPHAGIVTHASDSTDPNYASAASLVIADATFDVTDDDVAGITVVGVPPNPAVAEAGATSATYDLVIDTVPLTDVVVDIAAVGPDVTVSPSSVTFVGGAAPVPQTITVTAVDDALVEGPHTDQVTHVVNAGASDPGYGAVIVAPVTVDVTDDDIAGITVQNVSATTLDEAASATTQTFDVVLDAEPTANVDVAVGTADGQTTVDLPVLTFTSGNWNVPQTVTVTVVDDAVAEATPHPGAVTFASTSGDSNFNALTAPDQVFDISDDDVPGFVIVDSPDMTMDEADVVGTERTMSIALETQPAGADEVVLTIGAGTQLGLQSPATLTFDSGNWNVPQPIVVRAIDDFVDEASPHPGVLTLTVDPATTDAGYLPLTIGDRTFDIADDDTAGITFTPPLPGPLAIHEDGSVTATYDIVLTSQPTADVAIAIAAAGGQASVDLPTVTFTSATWNVPQTVTVTAVQDPVDEADPHADQLTHAVTSADGTYGAFTPGAMDLSITDDDTAGVTVTQVGAPQPLAEDGSVAGATYTVELDSQPTADVTITLGTNAQVDPSGVTTLTFTTANWNVPQTVTVDAIDDLITEATPHAGLVTHASDSTDPNYASAAALVIADATFDVTDDDVAGISVVGVPPNPAVAEAGATSATYDLVIDTVPFTDVVVDVAAAGPDVTVSPATITFPGGAAPAPQTITVTAVDDALVEGPHTDQVTHVVNAGASDPGYGLVVVAPTDVDVTDDDVAGITVQNVSATTLDEGTPATTQTFEVVLDAEPTADVDVAVGTADSQTTVDLPTVTFTGGNWNVPQTVTVTVVDDPITEPTPHTGTVTFASTSGDSNFNALTAPDLAFDITDDDTPGFTIVDSPDMTMDEADAPGTERTMSIVLESQPAGADEVVLAIGADAQLDLQSPATLTFDSGNWNVPQQIVVRAFDDTLVEATPHPGTLSITVDPSTTDAGYLPLTISDRTFDITDDDVAGIAVTWTGSPAPVAVTEDGSVTGTYEVVLTAQPLTDVTVATTATGGQVTVDQPLLTFTTATWNIPQVVTVTGVQDSVDEASPHAEQLTHVMGGDAAFGALTPTPVDVEIADDDTAGVTVTQVGAPQPLAEDGSLPAASYDVVLDSQPTHDVTVTLTADAQVTPTPAVLTFTPGNWNVVQPVSVVAVDDLVAEADPHPSTITHASDSTDPSYASAAALAIADATFTIDDDDTAGITLIGAPPNPAVDENGATSATYEIVLDSTPGSDVTFDLTSGADVTVSPATITFTGGVAPTPQTITVTAVDDGLVEGPHTDTIVHAMNPSSDGIYFALPPVTDVTVDVADDDTPSVVVDDLGGIAVDEAGATTDTFTVVLGAQPTADVTVALAHDPVQLAAPTPASLLFTSANWNVPQTVTVQPIDDPITEGPHTSTIAVSTTSADAMFSGLVVPGVDVAITDDDTPAFVVTDPAPMEVDEADVPGTARTLNIALATIPATPVTVNLADDAQIDVGAPSVVLDSMNWNTGVDVTVTAQQDLVAEASPHPGVLSFTVDPSSDPAYAPLTITDRTFDVLDDETASITTTPAAGWTLLAGRLQMAEDPLAAGHTADLQIDLGTASTADVEIMATVTPAPQIDVPAPSVLIPAGLTGPVTLSFEAVDDAIAEGAHTAQITFDVISTDPIYDALTIPAVDVDIADNDTVGVTMTPAGPIAIAEGGASGTFDVVLQSQPTDDVTVTLLGDAQVVPTPATLTFTPANWNAAQTVTGTAVDDAMDEPDGHVGIVSATVASPDLGYDGFAAPAVGFEITDNDTPGVVVTPTDGGNAVTEGGAGDRISIQLGTVPLSDVTIDLTADAQVAVSPASVTFTPANWNVGQDVTIDAVQDTVIEGDHTGNVTFALTSLDASYVTGSAATPGAQAVAVTDDDLASVVVTQTDGTTLLTEAGQTDTYTLALGAQPTSDVTITPGGGTQVTAAPAALTFTPANWNTPQTVTLTAVQDSIDEPDPHTGDVAHTATTTAPGWTGVNLQGLTASITDDDVAEIVVGQSDDVTRVVEGAAQGDTITFRLTSQPTADVSIVAKGDAQVQVADTAIVLGPTSWRDPISLAVTAIDDQEVEGDHEGAITFEVSTTDASYSKATIALVKVAVGDNDTDESIDDFGEDEEDGEEGSRSPRDTTPPTTRRNNSAGTNPSRRTQQGRDRTDSGRTRLPTGASSGAGKRDTGVRTGARLGGEVTASKEPEEEVSKGPFAQALGWLKENWKLWLPILLAAAALAGTAAYLLRGDPVQNAAKAAGASGRDAAGRGAAAGAKGKKGKQPRKLRGGRKKRKDDEDEDLPGT